MKDHTYTATGVVIGGSLSALLYAYKKSYYIITNNVVRAAPYDTVGHEAYLAIRPSSLKIDAVDQLSHNLAMRGLSMFGDKVESVSVDPEQNLLTVFSNIFSPKKMSFSELFVFDDNNVSGLPFTIAQPQYHRVLDWFNVHTGTTHNIDEINDESSNFVKKIIFTDSNRIKGAKSRGQKDLISESLISTKKLSSVEYSHSMSRLKTISMMAESGIRPNKKINLELFKRQVFPVTSATYIKQGNITYTDIGSEDIINERLFS